MFSNDGPLGSTEAKGYGNFAVKFLHVSVTKLKTLKDITSVCELVRAIERCCACYLRVQDELSLDDEFYLPKLVFHVLNSVKHKVREIHGWNSFDIKLSLWGWEPCQIQTSNNNKHLYYIHL